MNDKKKPKKTKNLQWVTWKSYSILVFFYLHFIDAYMWTSIHTKFIHKEQFVFFFSCPRQSGLIFGYCSQYNEYIVRNPIFAFIPFFFSIRSIRSHLSTKIFVVLTEKLWFFFHRGSVSNNDTKLFWILFLFHIVEIEKNLVYD